MKTDLDKIIKRAQAVKDNWHNGAIASECPDEVWAAEQLIEMAKVLSIYSNYDCETVQHMDTEWLGENRVKIAVTKPLSLIRKCVGDPSRIEQDDLFTYGPKYMRGKLAREAIQNAAKGCE